MVWIAFSLFCLSTDRCQLKEPEKVESLQLELIKCLKYLIKHVHPNEEKRFYRYFDRLIEIRKLTELNKKQNTMLEKFQMSIIKNYPLMYECISEDITNVNQWHFIWHTLYLAWMLSEFWLAGHQTEFQLTSNQCQPMTFHLTHIVFTMDVKWILIG